MVAAEISTPTSRRHIRCSFYIPIGNRKRFTERDLERILETNRDAEKDRLLSAPPIHADWPAEEKTYEAFGKKPRPLSDRLARALVQLKK